MFGLPSIRLGRLFGIPIEANASWFLVLVLVTANLALGYFPVYAPGHSTIVYVAIGAVTALAFFASIVLHEISHSLVARAGGVRIAKITLFLFGGVSQMEEDPDRPGREFVMAIAGPGMSLAIAVTVFGLAAVLDVLHASTLVVVPLYTLAYINAWVGAFNLLPGFPMDGGRVLRSIFWGITGDLLKSTRWAARIGQGTGYVMMGGGLFYTARTGDYGGLWIAFLGWFLASLAGNSYRAQLVKSRMAALPVSAIMSSPAVTVPGDTDLATLVDHYFLGGRHSRYPIVVDGRLAGLVSLSQVKDVPRDSWGATRAVDIADRDLGRLMVAAEAPAESVRSLLTPGGPSAMLVIADGRLAGLVTRSDVVHAMQASGT